MLNCILQLLLIAGLSTGMLSAKDHFIGKWKLNPFRSKLTDEMKVESVGGNKYAFDFGSGNTETIVADGKDQPGIFATTLSVTVESPNTWKVVRKKDGQTVITASWRLSEDGGTLTDHFTGIQSNGTTFSLDYVYKRTAGTTGFAGTWESKSEQVNSVYELLIQPYESDGLSFVSSAEEITRNIKFDGKDYQTVGPNLPTSFASSGRRLNARTLRLTDKIDGKILNTQRVELSSDLKTLTITVYRAGQSKPRNILVFDRE